MTPATIRPEIGSSITWLDGAGVQQSGTVRAVDSHGILAVNERGLQMRVAGELQSIESMPSTESTPSPLHPTPHTLPPGDMPRGITFQVLPLDRLRHSGLNPRKQFDQALIDELAASIRAVGILEPLVVRPIENAGPDIAACHPDTWEIVCGARRYHAAMRAGLEHVPCLIRDPLSNVDMLEIMLTENDQRSDVTDLERAAAYQQLLDLGVTQAKLAEKTGRSQSYVSRALGLLGLPPHVQDLLAAGKLSRGHGDRLLKWKDRPALCTAIGVIAAEQARPVKELDEKLPFERDLINRRQIRTVGYGTAFDWEKECAGCPHLLKINDWRNYCLEPAEYDRKEKAAKAVRKEVERAQVAAEIEKAGVEASDELPLLDDLKHGTYTIVRPSGYGACARACTAECPCRSQVWDKYGKRVVPICTDPKRYDELLKAQEAADLADVKAYLDALIQDLVNYLDSGDCTPQARELLFLVHTRSRFSRAAVAEALELLGAGPDLREALLPADQVDLTPLLEEGPRTGAGILILAAAIGERNERLRWTGCGERMIEWYLRREPRQPHSQDVAPQSTESTESIPSGLSVPYDPSDDDDEEELPTFCARCGNGLLAPDIEAGLAIWELGFSHASRETQREILGAEGFLIQDALTPATTLASGAQLGWGRSAGLVYCAACAPTVQVCAGCGCTDEAACEGGCEWVGENLCSSCRET